jgi:3-hydroxyacyl-[acyl-carrier-protein] dehydratase
MTEENLSTLNIKDILNCIPHRYPFLLIDRIISFHPLQSITALKNVTMNEPFFNGHFPGEPIMPGVLILEAMAQAAAVLASLSVVKSKTPPPTSLNLFAGIDSARFKRVVVPGDQLILHVDYQFSKKNIHKFIATAKVADMLVCSAELLTATKELSRD